MTAPRIALIHAMPIAIEPTGEAFRELWPQARITNLLEDSLAADLAAAGAVTPASRRFNFRLCIFSVISMFSVANRFVS